MITTFSIVAILVIIPLPIIIYIVFRLNDYYGYIQGLKFLVFSVLASFILNLIIPKSTNYKTNSSLEVEQLMELSMKERAITLALETLHFYITFLIMYHCISPLSRAPQNPKSIFHFISGIIIQYVVPFFILIILPKISKNEKLAKAFKENNVEKYLTEEYFFDTFKRKLSEGLFDIGMSFLILFYQKNLISKGMCYLNYFLPRIVRFLILICELTFISQYMSFVYIVPFVFGFFYYCKFAAAGKITNKIKDDSETD